MLNFVKSFESKIKTEMQFTLLAIISAFYIFLNLSGRSEFFPVITVLLPSLLIVYAIYILVSKKAYATAHLVLLLLTFSNGLGTFIRSLFSYHFGLNVWTTPVSWQIIVGAIASIYLILMCLSFLMNNAFEFKWQNSIYLKPLLLLAVYTYVANSMGTLIIILIPIILALMVNAGYAALMLMLAQVITVPFVLINLFVTGGIRSTNLLYWIINACALFLIFIFAKMALEQIHADETSQESVK